MTYKINDKPVPLRQFSRELTFKVFRLLDSFDEMSASDLLDCKGDIEEIADFVKDQLLFRISKEEESREEYEDDYMPYERLTGHEMGVRLGRP